jgi:hypothetical protein
MKTADSKLSVVIDEFGHNKAEKQKVMKNRSIGS